MKNHDKFMLIFLIMGEWDKAVPSNVHPFLSEQKTLSCSGHLMCIVPWLKQKHGI